MTLSDLPVEELETKLDDLNSDKEEIEEYRKKKTHVKQLLDEMRDDQVISNGDIEGYLSSIELLLRPVEREIMAEKRSIFHRKQSIKKVIAEKKAEGVDQ